MTIVQAVPFQNSAKLRVKVCEPSLLVALPTATQAAAVTQVTPLRMLVVPLGAAGTRDWVQVAPFQVRAAGRREMRLAAADTPAAPTARHVFPVQETPFKKDAIPRGNGITGSDQCAPTNSWLNPTEPVADRVPTAMQ